MSRTPKTPKTPKRRTRRPRKSQRRVTRRQNTKTQRGGMEGRTTPEHVLSLIRKDQGLLNNSQWRSHYEPFFLNKEFAMGLVNINGDFLMDLGDDLRNDPEVVLAAVRNNGLAIQYAGDGLRANKEIAAAAIQQNAEAIYDIDSHLCDDNFLMKIAIQKDPKAIQLHSKLMTDPGTVPNLLEAISLDPHVIELMPLITEDTIKLKLAHMRLALAKGWSIDGASEISQLPEEILRVLQEYLTIIRLASFIKQSTFCLLCNPPPEFQRLQDRLEQVPLPEQEPEPEPEPEQ